jgi:hypothetical protein
MRSSSGFWIEPMHLKMMLLLELILRSLIALLLIFHALPLLLELLLRFLRTLQLMMMVHPILLLMKLCFRA